MKISYNWLSDYVPLDGLSAEALADLLTMVGLEVDGVERHGRDLSGVVVGEVQAVRPHPNADRLVLCDVDLGEAEPVQVVCGAPNVEAGQKVPVATVGTTLLLPSRETGAPEQVTLRQAKIRGEVSQGMICAEDELGLSDNHAGIMVLASEAEVGESFEHYLERYGQLRRDITFDVALTPNRPDAASHLGVARDLAAVLDQPLQKPKVKRPKAGGQAGREAEVEIRAPEACPRYVAVLVRGVAVGESPPWLKRRLEAVGLRPINNVVDATNYVMYEVGQPLHAFDLDRLAGNAVVVRQAEGEETFTTLDDVERTLPAGALLICDAERPVAVAGVMGGANSEVTAMTRNVLIESAYFDPATVRRTAKALGLQTDASYRFERGVDPEGQPWAAARAAALLAEVAGGEVVPGMVDAHPQPFERRRVVLRPRRVSALLGAEIATEEMTRLLEAIGFGVDKDDVTEALLKRARQSGVVPVEEGEVGLVCTVPSFRPDVEREVDVIEEVARLWGYGRIPTPPQARVPLVPPHADPERRLRARARRALVGLGFRELYTNSLLPTATAERFAAPELMGVEVEAAVTANAISRAMSALRPSLVPGLLEVMAYNQNRGAGALRLFEHGHVYGRLGPGQPADPTHPVAGYHEHPALALGLSGPARRAGWDEGERAVDFFDLKGVVLHLLEALGLAGVEEVPSTEAGALTTYRLFLEHDGQRLGVLARVADDVQEAFDLPQPAFVAELRWDVLAAAVRAQPPTRYAPVARHPEVDRDVAVLVDAAAPVGPMLRTIRSAAGELLKEARVFDLYEGEQVGAGQKSVAFALRFGTDRTLTDEAVDAEVRRIVGALEREHGAALRQ